MKTRKITLLALSAVAGILTCLSDATAQARLQIIHNSAAISLDSVDVYVDDVKIDNINFRRATGLLSLAAGTHTINVNDRNSADSGDMVMGRFSVSLVDGQSNLAVITGVDMTGNYLANPDAIHTDLQLVFTANTLVSPSNNSQTAINIVHGVTDAAGADIYTRPNTLLLNSIRYGDVSANILVASSSTVIDVRDSNGVNVLNSYIAPFQSYAKKSLVVFASGFMDGANNQNGLPFGLYAVDTNGGDAFALQPTARIQFVHNSPDYIIDTVDIWANNVKIVDNLPFRKATAMLNIAGGTYDLTIAKKFSVDTSAAVTLYRMSGYVIENGKTYLGFVSGVVDTTQYATNPDGADRSFTLVVSNSYKEGTTAGQVELTFMNGTPDAPQSDLNEIGLPGLVKVGNDIGYGMTSPSLMLASGNTLFNITSADSTLFRGAYKLNTNAFSGRAGVVFTSGVNVAQGNPTPAKPFAVYSVFSDGSVVELLPLTAEVQLVHNSADITLDTVDVYVNGNRILDNFSFRHATPFVKWNAAVPQVLAIAPKTSSSATEAVYTKSLLLDSASSYYLMMSGVINVANYVANPNGKAIALNVYSYKGAKKLATASKNVDLLYFHGATDLRTTTIKVEGQVQYLSKDDNYGGFHGYAVHTAQDNMVFEVTDATNIDNIMYSGFINLATHQGAAGLVFASGFDNASNTVNQNGDTLIMFVVWPDGEVDSIAPAPPVTTGINESSIINKHSVNVFPNPSTGLATITLQANAATAVTVSVVDISGKQVLNEKWNLLSGANARNIDLQDVDAGLYFVKVTTADAQQLMYKIMIAR